MPITAPCLTCTHLTSAKQKWKSDSALRCASSRRIHLKVGVKAQRPEVVDGPGLEEIGICRHQGRQCSAGKLSQAVLPVAQLCLQQMVPESCSVLGKRCHVGCNLQISLERDDTLATRLQVDGDLACVAS